MHLAFLLIVFVNALAFLDAAIMTGLSMFQVLMRDKMNIQRLLKSLSGRYGSPKIFLALRTEGIVISRKRVARLMREYGFKARVERVYKRLNKIRTELKALPNHRLQTPKPTEPNQQWSSDVTYIRHGRRYVFLAVIVDLWSREIIGWTLHEKLNTELYALVSSHMPTH